MSRTVLITGATGTVSGAQLKALHGADLNPRALVRNDSATGDLRSRGVEVVIGDLDDPERCRLLSRACMTSGCSPRTARAPRRTT